MPSEWGVPEYRANLGFTPEWMSIRARLLAEDIRLHVAEIVELVGE